MRKVREILRLRFDLKHSYQKIGASVGISSSTASDTCARAKLLSLNWPLPPELTDGELESRLYPSLASKSETLADNAETIDGKSIDFTYIHKELKRKSVTLTLLWNEYKSQYPDGYKYSQFCYLYREWSETLDVWMRQVHKAGEKIFVDYAGQTMPIICNKTGEVTDVQIFVGTLGASSIIYTEASWTQTLPDWIGSHVNAFEFFEGCPEIIVPDNLKSGIQKAHIYEPDINPSYNDMATYYGVAIMPTRSRSPQDKAKVENSVLQVERQILAPLRNHKFFSLNELNDAMRPLLDDINNKPFQKLPGTRLSQFLELDKPALKPLPATRYEYAEWKKVTVGFNYHIEIDKHFYSVPFTLVKQKLHVRYTTSIVEVFDDKSTRVASHLRSYKSYGYTTLALHMPKAHQHQAEWTPERITKWAKTMGDGVMTLCETIMNERPHPEQAFRACIGIIRLSKSYGEDHLESACKYALSIRAHSYKSIESILKKNMDQLQTDPHHKHETITESHEYIRGKDYFE